MEKSLNFIAQFLYEPCLSKTEYYAEQQAKTQMFRHVIDLRSQMFDCAGYKFLHVFCS